MLLHIMTPGRFQDRKPWSLLQDSQATELRTDGQVGPFLPPHALARCPHGSGVLEGHPAQGPAPTRAGGELPSLPLRDTCVHRL